MCPNLSQVTFFFNASIDMFSKQLHNDKQENSRINVANLIKYECNSAVKLK